MLRYVIIIFLLVVSSGTCYASQASNRWNQVLFDAVHFAENGNDIVIEIHKIRSSLKNGANPNWINPGRKHTTRQRTESILSRYVFLISIPGHKQNNSHQGIMAIKELFNHGAKIQPIDAEVLFFPIAGGNYKIVQLLLDHGASARSWPKSIGTNLTPIEYAIEEGYDDIAKLLKKYGAKNVSKNDEIQLKFIGAASKGSLKLLKRILKQGAKINGKNRSGETALGNALNIFVSSEDLVKIDFLLNHGADPNIKSVFIGCHSCLPLHYATIITSYLFRSKNIDHNIGKALLKDMLDHGAYVSGRDDARMTPLHYAAKYNNIYAAKLFLKRGALVMPKDRKGNTPLDYAESAKMIKLLKKHGAKEI